ncbi:hypothetical protein EVAR_96178_1 [Eumeta japonica]|uniref:Uncharacterized protein n=1 Tax=Eumeta variegata TaxID=151549 RepID=A0A4C1VI09_EUMVA|nr:hypothetical protein EVAR_96178_1 [Eumeta japonica]
MECKDEEEVENGRTEERGACNYCAANVTNTLDLSFVVVSVGIWSAPRHKCEQKQCPARAQHDHKSLKSSPIQKIGTKVIAASGRQVCDRALRTPAPANVTA